MKAENSETQTKSVTQNYPAFKGKSELILQDNSSYKKSNENLIKNLGDGKSTIREKDKGVRMGGNELDKIEKLFSAIDQKFGRLEKASSEISSEIQNLKNFIRIILLKSKKIIQKFLLKSKFLKKIIQKFLLKYKILKN